MFHICLSCLIVASNDATPGITCEDHDAIAQKIEKVKETPQKLAEWTPEDVF